MRVKWGSLRGHPARRRFQTEAGPEQAMTNYYSAGSDPEDGEFFRGDPDLEPTLPHMPRVPADYAAGAVTQPAGMAPVQPYVVPAQPPFHNQPDRKSVV